MKNPQVPQLAGKVSVLSSCSAHLPAYIVILLFAVVDQLTAQAPTWSEEFNGAEGTPADPSVWTYEEGYQRNNELQFYTSDNGWHDGNGLFIIEAREEVTVDGQGANQTTYNYTSSSIISEGNFSWQYGRAQIRAKIPASSGMWPAIWQVGVQGEWPYNGECDIMEYYQQKILANCAVGNGDRWGAKWDASNRTMASLLAVDPDWKDKFHIWTMQWDEDNVRLYCDNILMNTIPQSWLVNTGGYGGSPSEPFKQPHHIWLNLAVGGNGGGSVGSTTFPQRYLIDYWRIWEGATDNLAPTDIALSANSVNENLPAGTLVGELTATDADPAEVFRYTLVAGPGDDDNGLFEIPEFVSDSTTLGHLKTAAVLNYDDGATRSIRVRVTDIEGATHEEVLTISVVPDPDIVVSVPSIEVPEGSSQTFDVKLRYLPASDVTVNVSNASGDADLIVLSGSSLSFTPENGTTWQQVTLGAEEDTDVTNGVATILCEDPSATFATATLTASEIENDNDSPVVEAGDPQTVYLSGSGGGASVTVGADVFLDAGLDDGMNNIWEDELGLWSPTIDPAVAFVENPGSGYTGITKSYNFPGGLSRAGGCEGLGLQDMGIFEDTGTGRDRLPISLEIWFKPDPDASNFPAKGQILWETGGGTGLGIFYNNGTVVAAHDSYQGSISADVSELTTEFIQVVVTYDTLTNADSFSLYTNGAHVVTSDRDDPDMCGGDSAGLGMRGEKNTGGAGGGDAETTSFDGQIAIFRSYYNQILNAADVQANYDAVAGEQVEATLDATVTDPNGEPTTVNWSLVSGPGAVRFADPSSVDTTVSFGRTGTYVLGLTAEDGTSVAGYDEVTITVALPGENSPPVFTEDPLSMADATENLAYSGTISGSATDADVDDTLSYAKVSGPAWLSVAADGTLSGTPTNADVGENSFTVSVTDGIISTPVEAALHITVVAKSYSDWASGPFPSGLALSDTNPDLDFDGGGLQTGLEWVFGGDPTDSSDDAALVPSIVIDSDGYIVTTYRRSDVARDDPNTTITLMYGSELIDWTAAEHDGTNIIINETDDGAGTGVDLVEVKISTSLVLDGKLFTRVQSEISP